MPFVVRAFVSVAMLVGFYLLALLQLVAGAALAIWVGSVTSGAAPCSVNTSGVRNRDAPGLAICRPSSRTNWWAKRASSTAATSLARKQPTRSRVTSWS